MLVFLHYAPVHLLSQPFPTIVGIIGALVGVYFYAKLAEED
jgi:hypothetical protein